MIVSVVLMSTPGAADRDRVRTPRTARGRNKIPPTKVITMGDTGVGKTRIIACYAGDEHLEPGPTIGVEALGKSIRLGSGQVLRTQLWDTAGQERYRAITRAHFRRVHCATLVYDITRYRTLVNAQQWLDELREETSDAVILLVGNKLDVAEDGKRQVSTAQGVAFAKENQLYGARGQVMFTELSALDPQAVHQAFEMLFADFVDRQAGVTPVAGGQGGAKGVELKSTAAAEKKFGCCNA